MATPADWPKDWREKAAGEDKGFLNVLKRYTDPVAALNWVRTQSLKIGAGELRPTLKADATPEEIAEYRTANGVPEKAEAYVAALKMPNGLVPGETDGPLLEAFAARAHAKHVPQDVFNEMTTWFFETQNQQLAARAAADQDLAVTSTQQLIETMGEDYKPNMNALQSFWAEQPAGIADIVLGARTADGKVIGNMPEVTTWLANVARTLNPAATLLPPGGDQGPTGIASRIAQIESQMYVDGKPNPAYFNGPMEKEYRQLIAAQERDKTRAA